MTWAREAAGPRRRRRSRMTVLVTSTVATTVVDIRPGQDTTSFMEASLPSDYRRCALARRLSQDGCGCDRQRSGKLTTWTSGYAHGAEKARIMSGLGSSSAAGS